MERRLAHIAQEGQQSAEDPGVERGMGLPAHVHQIPKEEIARVSRMEGIDLGMLSAVEVVEIVALNGLMEKRQTEDEYEGEDQKKLLHHWTGTPGWSVQTSVCGRSRMSSANCSGRPVRAGKVPKCTGITRRTLSMRQASAASRGLMV